MDPDSKSTSTTTSAPVAASEMEKETVHEDDFDSALEKPLAGDEDKEEGGFLEETSLQGEGFVDVGEEDDARVLPEGGEAVKNSLVEKGEVLGTAVLHEEEAVVAPSLVEKGDVLGTGVLNKEEAVVAPSLVEKDDVLGTGVLDKEEAVVTPSLVEKGEVLGTGVLDEEAAVVAPSLVEKGNEFVGGEKTDGLESGVPVEEEVETSHSLAKEGDIFDGGEKGAALGSNVSEGGDGDIPSGYKFDLEKENGFLDAEEKIQVSESKNSTTSEAIPSQPDSTELGSDAVGVEEEKVVDSQDEKEECIPVSEMEASTIDEAIQSRPDSTDFSGDAAKDEKDDKEADNMAEKALDDVSTVEDVPKLLQPNATTVEAETLGNLDDSYIVHDTVTEQPESNESAEEVSKVNGFDGQPTLMASGTTGSPISEVAYVDVNDNNEHPVELQPSDSIGEDSKHEKMPETITTEIKDAAADENIDNNLGEVENKEMAEFVSQPDDESARDIDAVDAAIAADEDKTELNEVDEEGSLVSERSAKVAILESTETAKQILKDLDEGSPSSSTRDYSPQMEGQIVTDSDEEVETDEEGDGKELFDSAALAALLRAATGASSDGNVTISAPDAARIFSIDRPAGLGSSVPLRPGPARTIRSSPFGTSDLAVPGDAENTMDEEEKKLHDKVEQIRVKFLRLVHRLGHSPEDTVAAQVLYRLGLAEGIKRGRQTSRVFSLENAKRKAQQLEESGQEDLEFSCNILVLGKSGVGKSDTINSIFGERVANTNAFRPTTDCVKEITGIVDGVKVRFLDTPGLTPSVMDQSSNKRILLSVKKYTKKCPPDIVLYIDRLDTQTRDFNDLPLLRSITSVLGSSIWFNAIVALTHAASAPPDGPNGTPLGYDVFVAQRSHVVQHSIRQAAGDMRLMNPVALVENHPSCRRNREGQRVLPNGITWRPQLLLLCYSSKTLSEANSLLNLQDPSPGKLFGFRTRSPPLPYLLSSLLQSRPHPKLPTDQGDNGDSDVDLGDLSDSDQEEEEDEYDRLPPFKPLKKSQIEKLTKEHRKAYFEEYDYRVKLLQKKQLKEEIKRMREMKKREKSGQTDAAFGEIPDDYDQDGAPAAVPVPLPDMVLPPTFDCDNPAYRYRFLEPTSQLLARPVLDSHGWDHDCGYDGVSVEENRPLAGRFPAGIAVQITKDKKEFNIHVDSSVAAKHGENGSTLAGFDIQSIGKQLAYIVRSETKFKNFRKNKTAAGISVTFLGEHVATGVKVEDQILIGNRLSLVGSTGAIRSQGDMAYGANLEAKLREKDYPIGQDVSTLGLSLMKWRNDLALGANLQTQISVGRNSKMAVRVGLNNKLTGQISVRTSSSEQLQLALLGILPIAMSIFNTIWYGELVQ